MKRPDLSRVPAPVRVELAEYLRGMAEQIAAERDAAAYAFVVTGQESKRSECLLASGALDLYRELIVYFESSLKQ